MPDRRDAFIPARKQEIIAALAAHGGLAAADAERLTDVCKLVAAILHFEAHDKLETMKALYAPLDPDTGAGSGALAAFEATLLDALSHANFTEIDPKSAVSRKAARDLTGLWVKTSDAGIRSIRFFARGPRTEQKRMSRWFGLKHRMLDVETFAEVIVLVAFKADAEVTRKDRRAFKAQHGVRPGAALVKHFRNVAHAELLTLHPGAKPTMRAQDQVLLAAPALIGGVPIALQIAPAVTVLFAVLAAYFGTRAAIDNSALQRALAAVSGLVAVGAFVMRQWVKYERQNLKYQKQLSDTVYFRNVANNSGVLDSLIGAGEDQDVKEAVLAYALLLGGGAMNKAALDARVETFLRAQLSLSLDFEIGDALGKLERLGLVLRDGDTLSAAPPTDALARLDKAWDDYFKFNRAQV